MKCSLVLKESEIICICMYIYYIYLSSITLIYNNFFFHRKFSKLAGKQNALVFIRFFFKFCFVFLFSQLEIMEAVS